MKKYFLLFLFLFLATFAYAYFKQGGKDALTLSCRTDNFSGLLDSSERFALFESQKITIPELAFAEEQKTNVLGVASTQKWIDVDLSDQKLRAWEGDKLYLETPVSTGLPWWPTPKGEFSVWMKLRAAKMEGGEGKYYYYLPNVPYVMFFENTEVPGWKGFGLHGTYWHNSFGTPRSHGCVNLPTPIAESLYYWTGPVMPDGKSTVRASADNPGTRIVVHE